MNKDYYKILCCTLTASLEEIRRNYFMQAKKYHPDKNESTEATVQMQMINEAFQVLSDPNRRWRYDLQYAPGAGLGKAKPKPRKRKAEPTPKKPRASKSPKTSGFGWVKSPVERPSDLNQEESDEIEVGVTLEEVLTGCTKKIKAHRLVKKTITASSLESSRTSNSM